jgi:uncharacterized protein YkwD
MRRPVLIVGGMAVVTVVAGIAVAASASAGTTTHEAEASTNTFAGGAHAVDCRRCSGGSRVTGIGGAGVLTITGVLAEKDGPTRLAVTYTGERNRTAQISVNGGVPTAIVFPGTRSTARLGTLRFTATLRAGRNDLAFANSVGAAPDIDKVVITTDGTPPTTAPTATVSGVPGATATVTPGETAPPTLPTSPPASGSPAPSNPDPTGTSPGTATPDPEPTTPPTTPNVPTTPPTTRPPTTAPTTKPPATTPTGNAALEAEVVTIVNTERAKAGCPALTADDRLIAAARGHSADMAARGYFSHTTPEGVEFATRITSAGYRWSGAGENIAKGQRTPADVMTSWMNSAGHKANILNCGFKNIGVGVAADAQGSLVWTQEFASPL